MYRDLLAGVFIGHGLYALTPDIAIGVEGLMQRGMHPSVGCVVTQLSGSLVAKYEG